MAYASNSCSQLSITIYKIQGTMQESKYLAAAAASFQNGLENKTGQN